MSVSGDAHEASPDFGFGIAGKAVAEMILQSMSGSPTQASLEIIRVSSTKSSAITGLMRC